LQGAPGLSIAHGRCGGLVHLQVHLEAAPGAPVQRVDLPEGQLALQPDAAGAGGVAFGHQVQAFHAIVRSFFEAELAAGAGLQLGREKQPAAIGDFQDDVDEFAFGFAFRLRLPGGRQRGQAGDRGGRQQAAKRAAAHARFLSRPLKSAPLCAARPRGFCGASAIGGLAAGRRAGLRGGCEAHAKMPPLLRMDCEMQQTAAGQPLWPAFFVCPPSD